MEKEFIPYEQALSLKELCFDKECFGIFYDKKVSWDFNPNDYNTHLKAPLYQQAFRWFRERYEIFSSVWCFETEEKFFIDFGFGIHKFKVINKGEAELECLKKLIEIVKNK